MAPIRGLEEITPIQDKEVLGLEDLIQTKAKVQWVAMVDKVDKVALVKEVMGKEEIVTLMDPEDMVDLEDLGVSLTIIIWTKEEFQQKAECLKNLIPMDSDKPMTQNRVTATRRQKM